MFLDTQSLWCIKTVPLLSGSTAPASCPWLTAAATLMVEQRLYNTTNSALLCIDPRAPCISNHNPVFCLALILQKEKIMLNVDLQPSAPHSRCQQFDRVETQSCRWELSLTGYLTVTPSFYTTSQIKHGQDVTVLESKSNLWRRNIWFIVLYRYETTVTHHFWWWLISYSNI